MTEFTIIPMKMHRESTAEHQLFCKQPAAAAAKGVVAGKADASAKEAARTVIINGLPTFLTAEHIPHLKRMFERFAPVTSAHIAQKTPDGSTPKPSHVVFAKRSSARALLTAYADPFPPKPLVLLESEEDRLGMGLMSTLIASYASSFLDEEAVEAEVADYMTQYDARTTETKATVKEQENTKDADGWTLVTRKRGVPYTDRVNSKLAAQAKKKREDQHAVHAQQELQHFYKFQVRQSKTEHIQELRKKFEEDKARVAKMKQDRKFKPFS